LQNKLCCINMKNVFLFLVAAVLLFSCDSEKKSASALLLRAEQMFTQTGYDEALNLIDSIKILYPRQYEVLTQGVYLRRKVEKAKADIFIRQCDSILPLLDSEIDSIKRSFVYEKDTEYDEVGRFFDKTQKIENKIQRSYLKCWTDENGNFFLASVYYGKTPIHHTSLRVVLPDGSYTETETVAPDGGLNYTFSDLGMTTEVVTYRSGKDGGTSLFIFDNQERPLKAEYLGGKRFVQQVSLSDKKAIAQTLQFATLLKERAELKEKQAAMIEKYK